MTSNSMNYFLMFLEPFPGHFAFCPVACLGHISEMKAMSAHRYWNPFAFLAWKLSSKQLQLHYQGGAAASQPRERTANPSLPDTLKDPSTNPSGFGTSCYPLGPPAGPAEIKAAFLLPLRVTTALRRHHIKCRGHDAISMQTCSIKTFVSHLFGPHGSQSSSQIKHVKHHCLQLGNVL